jgi:hypothetical protein
MSDIASLAQQAMNVVGPLLPLAGAAAGHLADGFLSEPGAKLYDWLVAKFKGTPGEVTLNRAVAEPENKRRIEALRLEIEDVAEKDSEFLEQLAGMLKKMNLGVNATQTANVTGDNNKTAQAAGKNINIHIG